MGPPQPGRATPTRSQGEEEEGDPPTSSVCTSRAGRGEISSPQIGCALPQCAARGEEEEGLLGPADPAGDPVAAETQVSGEGHKATETEDQDQT